MAGTNLNFPYDEAVFNYSWKTTPDIYLTSMIESGAVVRDSEIEKLISNGSNSFETPFYDLIGGAEEVYNGVNDIGTTSLTGDYYKGVVYGRQKGWDAKSFIKDFNSGADPMEQIVNGVAKYWIKKRQERLVKLLEAVFDITADPEWATHTSNIAVSTATPATEANKIGATTIADACIKACGDNANNFTLVIAHSAVASRLANLQLLEYSKYTDPAGITRALPIGTINGMTLIVNDNVPAKASESQETEMEYTTYILGLGAIKFATAPVDKPSEMERNASKNGGTDFIYTRIRECLHPTGFSFKGNVVSDVGIPDSVLTNKASWERKMPTKNIFMARVITNG